MKTRCTRTLLSIGISLFVQKALPQSVTINTTGATAAASAILDVNSTSRGVLIPRLTTAQRTVISSPATGLLVFDTNTNLFWFYTGTVWSKLGDPANNWRITGNSATVAGTHFMGTTDATDVVLKTNNTERMRWSSAATKNTIATISSGDLQVNNVSIGLGSGNVAANTAMGYAALYANTTGNYNTALGYNSMPANTTGGYNTSNGSFSMYSNTSGLGNAALGSQSLYSNTTGYANTVSGYQSLYSNTTGYYNVALGYQGIYSNTTGYYNTASGSQALYYNTTVNNSTACGYQSLYNNSTGTNNTAMGYMSLAANVSGFSNTALGYQALGNNTAGIINTAVGNSALLADIATYSTCTGSNTLSYSGSYIITLGYMADVANAGYSNSIAIGYNATVNASNKVVLGNSAVTVIGGQVGWSTLSDGRFKTNIKENVPGLAFIKQLRPVNYQLQCKKFNEYLGGNKHLNSKNAVAGNADDYSEAENLLRTGFIAQEVAQTIAKNRYALHAVHTAANATDNYSITYDELVVPLVKAMQQQQQQIEKQRTLINKQQQLLNTLKQRLEQLEQQ